MSTYFQYQTEPAVAQRIDRLTSQMVQAVGGSPDQKSLVIVAHDFLVRGESLGQESSQSLVFFDPAMVDVQDGKYSLSDSSGNPMGNCKPLWHCTLNPVNGRGVPFNLDTGDEEQAIQQFVAQMQPVYEQNVKLFTCTPLCRINSVQHGFESAPPRSVTPVTALAGTGTQMNTQDQSEICPSCGLKTCYFYQSRNDPPRKMRNGYDGNKAACERNTEIRNLTTGEDQHRETWIPGMSCRDPVTGWQWRIQQRTDTCLFASSGLGDRPYGVHHSFAEIQWDATNKGVVELICQGSLWRALCAGPDPTDPCNDWYFRVI